MLSLCLLQSLHLIYVRFLCLDLTFRFLWRIPTNQVFSSIGLVSGVPIVLNVLLKFILEFRGRYFCQFCMQLGGFVFARVWSEVSFLMVKSERELN